VSGRQSTAWSLAAQHQQLLPKSEILENEILARTESAQKPTEEMSQRRNHGETILSEPLG